MLCECGLDPGIDHMLAMEVIDKVIANGGQVGNSSFGGKIRIETATTTTKTTTQKNKQWKTTPPAPPHPSPPT